MKSLYNSLKNDSKNIVEKKNRDITIKEGFGKYLYFKSSKKNEEAIETLHKNILFRSNELIYKKNDDNYMRNLNDLINKAKGETVSIKLLNCICENLFRILEANLMSVLLYDSENLALIKNSTLNFGDDFSKDYRDFKISEEDEYNIVNTNIYEGLKKVDDVEFENKIDFIKNDISYLGFYRIMNDDELVGVLLIGYKKNGDYINDKSIEEFCEKVGPIMKKCKIIDVLKYELRKRIELEKEMETFFNNCKGLICIIDKKGDFKKVGSQCIKVLGWDEKEFLLMNYRDLIWDKNFLEDFKMSENKPFINKYKCKYGGYKWLEINYKSLNKKNMFIVAAEDITEEINLEKEKEKLENKIQVENIKNKLFTNISHDFKTPLNIILATSQLMLKKIQQNTDNMELEKYILSIQKNSYRLLRLVNNIMDMTKIDAGYLELQLGNYDIVSLVEDTTMSVVEYAKYKGIELIFDTNVEEKIIACDPEKIERIVLNLLSNAVKHTPENGKIDVLLLVGTDSINISVKDNGEGIEKDNLEKIFDRFRQVDALLSQRAGGTGIGLSLVKSLVELHEGKITAISEVKKGAEFIVKLPIKVIKNSNIKFHEEYNINANIEKYNMEFSDIY